MSITRRILGAVTLRRVVVGLLIGAFAEEIFSFLTWLVSAGWELKDVSALRACLLAGVQFALDATLIYLAVRGLEAVLERRRRDRETAAWSSDSGEHDPTVPLEEVDGAGTEAAGWPREGGGDGRGPDYY